LRIGDVGYPNCGSKRLQTELIDVWQYVKDVLDELLAGAIDYEPLLIQKRSASIESTSEKTAPNGSSSIAKTAVRSDSRLLDPSTHA